MKLKTSFFNPTVLKKNVTRFAPLWGLYTVFMLLFLLVVWDSGGKNASANFMNSAGGIMSGMSLLNFWYCGFSALLLFGDLTNARLCNALHAMPMRREGWFLTHLTAGFLFSFVPNLLGSLVAALILQEYCYGAFLWLAVMTLQFFVFFGIGTFCVLCAGNKLGAVVMYALVNFFSVIVLLLVNCFYVSVLPGIVLNEEGWTRLSPVIGMTGQEFISTRYDYLTMTTEFEGFVWEDWRYLFIAAAVGVVFLALALVVYRKRSLETAGDFISAKPAAPVFLVLYALSCGAVLYSLGLATGSPEIMLAVGLAIGFFTGMMLLERKVKVFGKKTLLWFGVFVVTFAASVGLVWLDPGGVTRYVPDPAQVESVQFLPYDTYGSRGYPAHAITDPEGIELVTQLHGQILEEQGEDLSYMTVSLRYELKNGRLVYRQYQIPTESTAAQYLCTTGSRPEVVLGTEDAEQLLKSLYTLNFHAYYDELVDVAMSIHEDWQDEEIGYAPVAQFAFQGSFLGQPEAEALVRALIEDCKAGNMAQHWNLHQGETQVGSITMQVRQRNGDLEYRDLSIYESCENTINCLKTFAPGK